MFFLSMNNALFKHSFSLLVTWTYTLLKVPNDDQCTNKPCMSDAWADLQVISPTQVSRLSAQRKDPSVVERATKANPINMPNKLLKHVNFCE